MKNILLFIFITLPASSLASRICQSPHVCFYTVDLGEFTIEVPHTPLRQSCGSSFLGKSIKASGSRFGSRAYFAYIRSKLSQLKNKDERQTLKLCLLSAATRNYGDVDRVPESFYSKVFELMEPKHLAQSNR